MVTIGIFLTISQLSAAYEHNMQKVYTFCNTTTPPHDLRVSSGEFTFGQTSPAGTTCMAAAVTGQTSTPRMDLDGDFYDFTVYHQISFL